MKRFTETAKWEDKWFRALSPGHKLVFLYLIDRCDNAGFLEWDIDAAKFHLGLDGEKIEGALKGLDRAIKGASGWIWIRTFLRHQKNEDLNAGNPAHRQIIRLIQAQLSRFDGIPEFEEFVAPYKGLICPIGIGIGNGKGKKESRERKETLTEEQQAEFDRFWLAYPRKIGKLNAQDSWKKKKPPLDRCLLAIEDAKASREWQRDNGQFIPHPATWINQGRWDDDVVINMPRQVGSCL